MTLRSFLREPLVHFLALGAGLFAIGSISGTDPGPGSTEIIVAQGKIEQLAEGFRRTWQRPPTERELSGLVDDHIKEEVFYREALAMGLEQDDVVIRRRLRQKMEFFTQDLARAADPTETELEQYLDANPDRFRRDGRVSFTQIYFNADRRGKAVMRDAQQLLDEVRGRGPAIDAASLGDPIMLGAEFEDLPEREVASLFGRAFAAGVMTSAAGEWTGPIESGYGLHLVLVRGRSEGSVPPLAEVADEVRREVLAGRQRTLNKEVYERLRERYAVTVDWPAWARPDTSEAASR